MELEKLFEGVELSDEVKAALGGKITEAVNAEVSGLKGKVEELLSEKKTEAQKAKEADEARKAAELEAAKKAGDLDRVKEIMAQEWQGKVDTLSEQVNGFKTRELTAAKQAAVNNLKGHGVDADAFGLLAGQLVETAHNEQGEVVVTYKGLDGSAIGTSQDDFLGYARKDASLSKFIKASDASGGGANGSNASSGADGKMTDRDRAVADINAKFGKS